MAKTITILDRDYSVPEIRDGEFVSLQSEIQRKRQALAKDAKQSRLRSVFPFGRRRMSDEERLDEMENLVTCYNQVIEGLGSKIGVCEAFFKRIGEGVRQLFKGKVEEIRRLDSDRRGIVERSRLQSDSAMEGSFLDEEKFLQSLAVNLTQASLLIIKKLSH